MPLKTGMRHTTGYQVGSSQSFCENLWGNRWFQWCISWCFIKQKGRCDSQLFNLRISRFWRTSFTKHNGEVVTRSVASLLKKNGPSMVLPPEILWWFCVTCCVTCSVNNPWGVCEAFRLLRPAIYSQIWELESQWWRRGCRNTKPSSSRTRRFVFFSLFSFRSFLSFFAHEVSLDDGAKKDQYQCHWKHLLVDDGWPLWTMTSIGQHLNHESCTYISWM